MVDGFVVVAGCVEKGGDGAHGGGGGGGGLYVLIGGLCVTSVFSCVCCLSCNVYKCIRKSNNWMNLEGVGQSMDTMMDHYKTQMESLKRLLKEKESIERRVVRSMDVEHEKAEALSTIGGVIRECREQLKQLNLSLVKKYKENKKNIFRLVDVNGNGVFDSSDEGSFGKWRVFLVSSMLWIIDKNNNTFFRDLKKTRSSTIFSRIFEEECLFEDFSPLILNESTITLTDCSIIRGFSISFVRFETPTNDPSHKYIHMYYREQAMGNVNLSPTTYEAFLASLGVNGGGL